MRNQQMDVYLNGIKMAGKRQPPYIETDKFIRAVVTDLFQLDQKPKLSFKHKCTSECAEVWTIAIGPDYTEMDSFMKCIPSDFVAKAEKYMELLSDHYGGRIKPEALVIHVKPCLKNMTVLKSELFVFSEDE